jgi:hypothetical protein
MFRSYLILPIPRSDCQTLILRIENTSREFLRKNLKKNKVGKNTKDKVQLLSKKLQKNKKNESSPEVNYEKTFFLSGTI